MCVCVSFAVAILNACYYNHFKSCCCCCWCCYCVVVVFVGVGSCLFVVGVVVVLLLVGFPGVLLLF